MAKNKEAQAAAPAVEEPKKTIILNHAILHDDVQYSKGQHTLPLTLADLFLTFKDPISRQPIAVIPEPPQVLEGTAKPLDAK